METNGELILPARHHVSLVRQNLRGGGAKRGDGTPFPRNLLTEIFVVENGRIRGIYAAMHYMTPDIPDAPGWK